METLPLGTTITNVSTPDSNTMTDKSVDLAGKVEPGHAGRSVTLLRHEPDGTKTEVAATTTDAAGEFEFTHTVTEETTFNFYVPLYTNGGDEYRRQHGDPFTVRNTLFYDTFNYESWAEMEAAGWALRQTDYLPAANRSHVKADASALSFGNSRVHLDLVPDPERPGYFFCGHVTTGQLPFVYGSLEARVRFGRPRGAHAAFWHQSGYGTDGAELDVVEFFGERLPDGGVNTQRAQQTVHVGDPAGGTRQFAFMTWTNHKPTNDPHPGYEGMGQFGPNETWWEEFHTFRADWTDAGYEFYVDGQHVGGVAPSGDVLASPSGSLPGELILSLLTSDSEYANLTEHLDAGGDLIDYRMSVAWVHVWD